MNRRRTIVAAGGCLAGVLAGCLSDGDPSDGTGANDSNDDDSGNDDRDPEMDPAEAPYVVSLDDAPHSVSGDLASLEVELVDPYVTEDGPAVLEVTLTNETNRELTSESGIPAPFGVLWGHYRDGDGSGDEDATANDTITFWSEAYEESENMRVDPNERKHVDGVDSLAVSKALSAGDRLSQEFELHVDTPHLRAGGYDATISTTVHETDETEDGDTLEIPIVVRVEVDEGDDGNSNEGIPEDPRVDEPPYDIDLPEPPADITEEDEWDDHYLGEHLPREPSLEFEGIETLGFDDRTLRGTGDGKSHYAAHLIDSEDALESAFDLGGMDDETADRFEQINFSTHCVVVVESGWGSGSVGHEWARVEEADDGVHVHGYYTSPWEQTDDITNRLSALLVERPDGDSTLELARVSLTVTEERRVHFNSTEGVVALED